MGRPRRLSFFNELDTPELEALFTNVSVARHLVELSASVTMGMRDLTDGRAAVMRRLLDDGIDVGAWLLLPREQGYFATLDNVPQVEARYAELREWLADHRLAVTAIGLDFEPDLRELQRLMLQPVRTLATWTWRATDRLRLPRALDGYRRLVRAIRDDGFAVETYQFPLLHDDRGTKSTWWQRLAGVVDVGVGREVVMLYTSLMGPLGAGVLASYAPQCRAIGVGSTGGGIDPLPKLTWDELSRDLRLASRRCDDLSIFSLEGCVEHAFLPRLVDFDWNARVADPMISTSVVGAVRGGLRLVSRALR